MSIEFLRIRNLKPQLVSDVISVLRIGSLTVKGMKIRIDLLHTEGVPERISGGSVHIGPAVDQISKDCIQFWSISGMQ